MKIFRTSFSIFCMTIMIANVSLAKEEVNGKSTSVVHIQELGSKPARVYNQFCPVRTDQKFQEHCKLPQSYYFRQAMSGPDADWVKVGKLKYLVQWVPAKTPGIYAWVGAKTGLGGYGIKQETLLAKITPGTILINSLDLYKNKAEQSAAVARVKAMFVQKYGATLTKQMTFKTLTRKSVICVNRAKAPKDGHNCTLQ